MGSETGGSDLQGKGVCPEHQAMGSSSGSLIPQNTLWGCMITHVTDSEGNSALCRGGRPCQAAHSNNHGALSLKSEFE